MYKTAPGVRQSIWLILQIWKSYKSRTFVRFAGMNTGSTSQTRSWREGLILTVWLWVCHSSYVVSWVPQYSMLGAKLEVTISKKKKSPHKLAATKTVDADTQHWNQQCSSAGACSALHMRPVWTRPWCSWQTDLMSLSAVTQASSSPVCSHRWSTSEAAEVCFSEQAYAGEAQR